MTLVERFVPPLARLRASSLGAKLALLGAASTVCVVGGAFAALRISTATVVRNEFVSGLHARQDQLRQTENRDRRLLFQSAEMLATSGDVHAALDASRLVRDVRLSRAVEHAAQVVDADMLLITDQYGAMVASAGPDSALWSDAALQDLPAVRNALGSSQPVADSAFGVMRDALTTMQVAAVPLVAHGRTIGALLVGRRLDRIVATAADATTRLVVVSHNVVLGSTLAAAPRGSLWRPEWSANHPGASTITLGGHEYAVVSLPLGVAQSGGHVDLYLVGSLDDALEPIERQLSHSFLLAGLLAVLLACAGGLLLSRTTLRPLSRFVEFMQNGAANDRYARFTEPHAPHEIHSLTETYNHLIESLQRGHEELQERTVDLAKVNHRLNRQMDRRERAERALRESEEQLRQAQKLEALGALAGGVAHDFNNILSIILGYAEIVQTELPDESAQRADVSRISDAAMRARALVRQLLAFSRKQVLQPQVLDLNQVVSEVEALLLPLTGEAVKLELRLADDLSRIKADPSQVEQVIINLAVNARDAMPDGGRLVIETANVTLEEGAGHHPLPGGPVVMLSVADTGIGMDAATRRRIFEPFFTTKPVGKGTGLGLATVYGIVRQSGGNITVFSEPGRGTTFRCYFPPEAADLMAAAPTDVVTDRPARPETILLAEDESELRNLMRRSLERQGYEVLVATDGAEAIDLASNHAGPINALVTDIVMPGTTGTELASRLTAIRPGMRVVFMSGYSDEAIARDGLLIPDTVYLEKPVSPETLSRALRELLNAALASEVIE